MSGVTQHSADLFAKVCGTDELVIGGGFQTPNHLELVHIVMRLYRIGALEGTERMRLNVYRDEDCTKLYASSDWIDIADIPGGSAAGWFGDVRFDFASPNINKNYRYYFAVETDGYTRNKNVRYIAFMYDWPDPIYEQTNAPDYALQIAIYGRMFL